MEMMPVRSKRTFGGGFDAAGGPHEMVANRPEKPHEETVNERMREVLENRELKEKELSAGMTERFQDFVETASDREKAQGSTKLPISLDPPDGENPVKYPISVVRNPEPVRRIEILDADRNQASTPLGCYGEDSGSRFQGLGRSLLGVGFGFVLGFYICKWKLQREMK